MLSADYFPYRQHGFDKMTMNCLFCMFMCRQHISDDFMKYCAGGSCLLFSVLVRPLEAKYLFLYSKII